MSPTSVSDRDGLLGWLPFRMAQPLPPPSPPPLLSLPSLIGPLGVLIATALLVRSWLRMRGPLPTPAPASPPPVHATPGKPEHPSNGFIKRDALEVTPMGSLLPDAPPGGPAVVLPPLPEPPAATLTCGGGWIAEPPPPPRLPATQGLESPLRAHDPCPTPSNLAGDDASGLFYPLASAAEQAQVAQMQRALAPDLAGLACARWADVSGEIRLLRFLRGFNHDVGAALKAVRNMLEVRRRYGIDAVHEKWAHVPCTHTSGLPYQEEVQRLMPSFGTIGLSHHGHVVCYNPLRAHRYRDVLVELGEARYLDFYVSQCESRMHQLHELSAMQRRLVKILMVIDLRAVSYWALTSRKWISFDRKHMGHLNLTMAEALSKVYIVNTPKWVLVTLSTLKKWLPANTFQKLEFLGGRDKYHPVLSEVMGAGTLSELYELMEADLSAAAPGKADLSPRGPARSGSGAAGSPAVPPAVGTLLTVPSVVGSPLASGGHAGAAY